MIQDNVQLVRLPLILILLLGLVFIYSFIVGTLIMSVQIIMLVLRVDGIRTRNKVGGKLKNINKELS